MLITHPNTFTATSRQVFDQTAGHHSLAKLAHKVTTTLCFCFSVCLHVHRIRPTGLWASWEWTLNPIPYYTSYSTSCLVHCSLILVAAGFTICHVWQCATVLWSHTPHLRNRQETEIHSRLGRWKKTEGKGRGRQSRKEQKWKVDRRKMKVPHG